MTWIDHHNPDPPSKVTEASMSSVAGKQGCHPRVILALRPWLMEAAPAWLKDGAKVRAMIGHGEHAGMVRLVADGKIPVMESKIGAKGSNQRPLLIKLRGIPRVPAFKPQTVECDWQDDWIEVVIPGMRPPDPSAMSYAVAQAKGELSPKGEKFNMTDGIVSREEMGRRSSVPVR